MTDLQTLQQEFHIAHLPVGDTFLSDLALRLVTASPDSQDASLGKPAQREQVACTFLQRPRIGLALA